MQPWLTAAQCVSCMRSELLSVIYWVNQWHMFLAFHAASLNYTMLSSFTFVHVRLSFRLVMLRSQITYPALCNSSVLWICQFCWNTVSLRASRSVLEVGIGKISYLGVTVFFNLQTRPVTKMESAKTTRNIRKPAEIFHFSGNSR